MQVLITAGGTREYIDPVRFISNASSGKMGLALALAALAAGHKVTLITANSKFEIRNSKLKIIEVETTREMFEAVKKHFPCCDCLLMAAAVADYMPVRPAKTKIKSAKYGLTIKLKPTADILKWAGKHKSVPGRSLLVAHRTGHEPRIIVGFALEDKNLRANAEKKLKEKNLDMIIANTTTSIGAEKTSVLIKTPCTDWLNIPLASKTTIAQKIISLSEQLIPRN